MEFPIAGPGGDVHTGSPAYARPLPLPISRGPVRPMMLKIRKRSKSSTPSTLISNPNTKTNYNTPSGSIRKTAASSLTGVVEEVDAKVDAEVGTTSDAKPPSYSPR